MQGLVPQLEHPAPLSGQVGAGVQGAQGFVGDLETEKETGFNFNVFKIKSLISISAVHFIQSVIFCRRFVLKQRNLCKSADKYRRG